jgi:transcriptional regulator with XRE-family HTH domain
MPKKTLHAPGAPAIRFSGDRLRYVLETLRLKQSELAARVGVYQGEVSKWLYEEWEPSASTLAAIAHAAAQPMEFFMVAADAEPEAAYKGKSGKPSAIPKNFAFKGEHLREALTDAGFTQKQFSELMGVAQPNMARWLKVSWNPTSSTLWTMAYILKKPMVFFMEEVAGPVEGKPGSPGAEAETTAVNS